MTSYEGRHNRTKCLCFTLLNGQWLRGTDLALRLDSPPASIRTLLSRWERWRLVTMSLDASGTRSYILSHKGYAWLSRHWTQFPLWRWTQELPPEKQPFFSFLFKEAQRQDSSATLGATEQQL